MATTATPTTIELAERYHAVRQWTRHLCEPLATEDYVVQSMPDASPTKWHLAHTSWFFETLVLQASLPGYRPLESQYGFLFNSYYNTLGKQWYRPHRGLITRPTVREVMEYRAHVDRAMDELFERADEIDGGIPDKIIEVGLHHEQQHQELLITDLKHLLSMNPLYPVYRGRPQATEGRPAGPPRAGWLEHDGGLVEIGYGGGGGFAYDNETPRHKTWLYPFRLATRPVTVGEYLEFMADGGYRRADLWLSDGWYTVQEQGWKAPLYWEDRDGEWSHFTLSGLRPVDPGEPVCHVSYYEADAYARWKGARLPTEPEWEVVAAERPVEGNFVESGHFHPVAFGEQAAGAPAQLFGDVWEWTSSDYRAYPGYTPPEGALGEYNAKFMSGQYVLRGGSCATPRSHIRATYRNFFQPDKRWQFSGIRLAANG